MFTKRHTQTGAHICARTYANMHTFVIIDTHAHLHAHTHTHCEGPGGHPTLFWDVATGLGGVVWKKGAGDGCLYIKISAVKRFKYLIAINRIYVIVNSKLIAINRNFLS